MDVQPLGQVVQFEEAEYYKLRTRIADAEAASVKALQLIAAKDALVKDLAAKYGFDPAFKTWQADDDCLRFSFA